MTEIIETEVPSSTIRKRVGFGGGQRDSKYAGYVQRLKDDVARYCVGRPGNPEYDTRPTKVFTVPPEWMSNGEDLEKVRSNFLSGVAQRVDIDHEREAWIPDGWVIETISHEDQDKACFRFQFLDADKMARRKEIAAKAKATRETNAAAAT